MTAALALVIGALYAAGIYMMLRRSLVKLLVGLILLSHAANLLIFTVAGITRGAPPLIREGETRLSGSADPLPQALVLTAIVISFGVLAFATCLFYRAHAAAGTDDLDEFRTTDP
ncbi:Na+/H+ antiporter subunit C [Myxococcota bacterium]|nr:Na+/H+ antiporter subunit C [Myxococcota bacterium]